MIKWVRAPRSAATLNGYRPAVVPARAAAASPDCSDFGSQDYGDQILTMLRSCGAHLVGNAYLNLVEREKVEADAIGGLVIGADPICVAVAYASYLRGGSMEAFLVRKEAKKHGMMRLIEGNVKRGDKVIVVDDVCTTGGSTQQAIDACLAEGLEIAAVMPLVDREEGGAQIFGRYRFLPLFRASEFL